MTKSKITHESIIEALLCSIAVSQSNMLGAIALLDGIDDHGKKLLLDAQTSTINSLKSITDKMENNHVI